MAGGEGGLGAFDFVCLDMTQEQSSILIGSGLLIAPPASLLTH